MLGQGQTIKDFQHRFPWLFYSICLVIFMLALRLVYLQVLKGNFYRRFSEQNSLRKEKLPGPRGLIFDRNYKLMVDNRLQMDVTVTPQFVKDPVAVITRLAEMGGESAERLLARYNEKTRAAPKFQPVSLIENAPWPLIVKIESFKEGLSGVEVEPRIRRTYLQEQIGAHLFGYIGEVGKEELEKYNKNGTEYELGDWIGKFGLERRWEKYLRGNDGVRFVVVNAHGHRLQNNTPDTSVPGSLKRNLPPQPGNNLVLTIDADLQEAAAKALQGKMGTVVALDPRTGEVLAMVSQPSFNPTEMTNKASELWQGFMRNKWGPLRNKAIQDHYPPGSTFKVMTAIAGLEAGVIDENTVVNCTGAMKFGNRTYHCHKTHGPVNLFGAIKGSCDIYFYQLAIKLGVDPISKTAMEFGFGRKSGIELFNEVPGLMPTEAWKMKALKQPWTPGENLSEGIGQGYNLVTPIQLANAYSTMINGGNLYRPYVVSRIENQQGEVVARYGPEVMATRRTNPKYIDMVKAGMFAVANDPHGTAFRAVHMKENLISGKTGTVQMTSQTKEELKRPCLTKPFEHRDHGWFAGFAPRENPEIVVVVFGLHECSGSGGAAPVARVVFDKWWEKKQAESALHGPQPLSAEQAAPKVPRTKTARSAVSVPQSAPLPSKPEIMESSGTLDPDAPTESSNTE
ncbi:MAG: penicillin-binding protein 2 [Bdellovibrionales bacterium]|nr:penicillin-binding protein 2 [Bdellovibrionales bacterium]